MLLLDLYKEFLVHDGAGNLQGDDTQRKYLHFLEMACLKYWNASKNATQGTQSTITISDSVIKTPNGISLFNFTQAPYNLAGFSPEDLLEPAFFNVDTGMPLQFVKWHELANIPLASGEQKGIPSVWSSSLRQNHVQFWPTPPASHRLFMAWRPGTPFTIGTTPQNAPGFAAQATVTLPTTLEVNIPDKHHHTIIQLAIIGKKMANHGSPTSQEEEEVLRSIRLISMDSSHNDRPGVSRMSYEDSLRNSFKAIGLFR